MASIVEYDGLRYELIDPVFKYHIERGISEPYPNHIRIVKNYLREFPDKNRTYLDIGGHIGTTALPYSRLFNTVYVYEPMPDNYAFLDKNIKHNNRTNITAIPKGVYNEDCRGDILPHGSNSGCYYFSKKETGAIECTSIDKGGYTNVDFIKVDVEGAEMFVLQGGLETIKTWKPLIQLEINGLSERLYNISGESIHDMMKSLGYELYDSPDSSTYFFYCPESC